MRKTSTIDFPAIRTNPVNYKLTVGGFCVLRRFKYICAFCTIIIFSGITCFATVGPKIEFANTVFDFGKVPAGEIIKHAFVFTNAGDQVLEIKDVRPSCGCTTASAWEPQLQPGKTGTIPIRFNSTEYTGPIHKTVIIISNDPAETNLILHIQGTIWRPIEVTPESATFLASSDARTNETKTIRILNNLDQPLTLSDPVCTNRAFQTSLKTVRPGKEFELSISLTPQSKAASLWAPVTLKTSSTNVPLLTVMARALVQLPITAMPSSIILPGHPLTDRLEFNITVRNNGPNPLVLSDAAVAADPSPGVTGAGSTDEALPALADTKASIQEVQPGRMFVLAASFPAGFQVEADRSVTLRVKTNHPQYPVLKVPVLEGHSLKGALSDSETKPGGQDK